MGLVDLKTALTVIGLLHCPITNCPITNCMSDNNLASELVENRSFLNQSQSRKLPNCLYYRPCRMIFFCFIPLSNGQEDLKLEVKKKKKEWQRGNVIVSLDLVHVMNQIIIIILVALLVPPVVFVCTWETENWTTLNVVFCWTYQTATSITRSVVSSREWPLSRGSTVH